ncbi:MAG: hypothetical protein DRP70_00165 [Spirochaetes bacterium]|nr:MAG: hypothetical protein DRP70_00165 [Spirochaetota bacterium]RKX98628.1 MAG: hypothetical protein DRZ90_02140 [Spirochaetota bacterium]
MTGTKDIRKKRRTCPFYQVRFVYLFLQGHSSGRKCYQFFFIPFCLSIEYFPTGFSILLHILTVLCRNIPQKEGLRRFVMSRLNLSVLSEKEVLKLHKNILEILDKTGVKIPHPETLGKYKPAGVRSFLPRSLSKNSGSSPRQWQKKLA